MSFLKRLFGGSSAAEEEPGEAVEHNGFFIRPTPFSDGGQYQTCGIVSKEIGGVTKEHRFIRADRFSSKEEAASHALRKGMQIVDEQGERIFDQ